MYDETYYAIATRCGEFLAMSRYRSGYSRKNMSKVMDVSESTIKSWEEGQGSPTFFGILEWCRTTGTSFFRAMLDFFWPNVFKGLSGTDSNSKILNALCTYIEQIAGPIEVKKLYYLIRGNHGSEWSGLLDMACAHEHTSLKTRCGIAEIISVSYDLSLAGGHVCTPPNINAEKDRSLLRNAIYAAKMALTANLNGYTICEINNKNEKCISDTLAQARMDAGVSRKDLAKALGKTERTIQNWENGFDPSFIDICMWFNAIRQSAWKYLQCAIYDHDVHFQDDYAETCRKKLIDYFLMAPADEVRKVSYLIIGEHGSNWLAMLEAMFEHTCSPLAQRVISARSVLVGYCIEQMRTEIVGINNILPDIDNLERCIRLGTEAAKSGKEAYYFGM